ncbi:MAG: dephospho-CoA kinase [Clostridiales bacterium]|nr:dephospho-CoA kinase [Clostridiales bacterium]
MSTKQNAVIGLVGMCGSGKSVLTQMFEERGFSKVYFGSLTMEEIAKRGIAKTPENEKLIREELREKHGPAAFAICLADRIEALAKEGNVVLDGLYSWSEYKYLAKRLNVPFYIVAIVTNRGLRYERLSVRTERPLTNDQAYARDVAEIENIEKGGPISIADAYIVNNSSVEDMKAQFEELLRSLDL